MADHRDQSTPNSGAPGAMACQDRLRAAVVDAARDWHAAHRPHLHHNPTVEEDQDRAGRRADTARAPLDAVAALDGIDDHPLVRHPMRRRPAVGRPR